MYSLQVLCFLLLSVDFNWTKSQSSEESQAFTTDLEKTTRDKHVAKRVLYLIDELDHHPPRCLKKLINVKFTDDTCDVYMYACTEKMIDYGNKYKLTGSSNEHSDSDSAEKSTEDDGKSTEDERPFKGDQCSISGLRKPRYEIKRGHFERCYKCHVEASINKDLSIKGIHNHKCQRTIKYRKAYR